MISNSQNGSKRWWKGSIPSYKRSFRHTFEALCKTYNNTSHAAMNCAIEDLQNLRKSDCGRGLYLRTNEALDALLKHCMQQILLWVSNARFLLKKALVAGRKTMLFCVFCSIQLNMMQTFFSRYCRQVLFGGMNGQ